MKLRPLPNTVVHLKTQAEYDEYMQMCEDAGWRWGTSKLPKELNMWYCNNQNTCVTVSENLEFSKIGFFCDRGDTILTLPELKAKLAGKEPKKQEKKKPASYAITSPDQLKHGMRVTCEIREGDKSNWKVVKDAMISIDSDGSIFVCQNVSSGMDADVMFGYRFSRWIVNRSGEFSGAYPDDVRNLRAVCSKPKKAADTWTLDAPIYRRGSDWIREDKMSIAGIEYTFDKVCEQEAKFRAFRRAHSRYFPKAK